MNLDTDVSLTRLNATLKRYGKSRTALYRDIQNKLFPEPVKLSSRLSAWPSYEVTEILRARIRGADDDAIRDLVQSLEAARKNLPQFSGGV